MDDDFDDESPTDPVELQRPRVLVVEDDDALREMISHRMHHDAFEVIEAGSAFEAMSVLDNAALADDLELIIMDVRLPGASGLEVANWIRESSPVPILLITAFPTLDVVKEATQLHCALLAKPFKLERLASTAIEVLMSSRFDARTAS